MKRIAVAYLCRFGNPPQASRAFLKSLLRCRAGAEFDLFYILKGFPEGQTDPALSALRARLPCAVAEVRVADEFLMINGLMDGAAQIPNELFLPLSSWSRIQAQDWLAAYVAAFERVSGCVVAGATGSHDPSFSGTPYPNAHVRTTGFLIDRKVFLGFSPGPLPTKLDNWHFESGLNGMTRRLTANGGKAVLVGRDRQFWLPEAWAQSRTFFSGQQENLLIADNQTQAYECGNFSDRRRFAKGAWNDESLAAPLNLMQRLRRFSRQTPMKMRRAFDRRRLSAASIDNP